MTDFKSLYPFASHWLDLDGARLHYLDEGPRDGPPVVMVHGNPTWSFYFRTLIPALAQTHRVIVPDHVGCGFSDKPQDYPYTLEQHIQNLERLIAHLGLRNITLALHDWGGGVGMGYATRHPETVARFVIFNTSAFFAPAIPAVLHLARSPLLGEFAVRGLNLFVRGALVWGTSQRARFTPEVRAGYAAPYDSWRNRIAVYRFVQDIPTTAAHPTRATIDAIDARLHLFRQHPMLILWGADDFVFTVKDFLAGWRARFPAAEVHVLENAGHYVVEDAHERILPLMQAFFYQQI
ncbi:MAG TPA: alpha/beta fold hydrolase [Anaerolineae bacterium]|nr:alpha/beta fold hydrolase [Anaerolineae bacterium]